MQKLLSILSIFSYAIHIGNFPHIPYLRPHEPLKINHHVNYYQSILSESSEPSEFTSEV